MSDEHRVPCGRSEGRVRRHAFVCFYCFSVRQRQRRCVPLLWMYTTHNNDTTKRQHQSRLSLVVCLFAEAEAEAEAELCCAICRI
jgi:hypothetical protein